MPRFRFLLAFFIAFVGPAIPVADCFCLNRAALESGVPLNYLKGIIAYESDFNPTAVHQNGNGTYDFGLGQINSSWKNKFGTLRWNAIVSDPCYNVRVAAWLLKDCLNRFGRNWEGIGCYNANDRIKRARYATKVIPYIKQYSRRSIHE